jgi:hypothetical protein
MGTIITTAAMRMKSLGMLVFLSFDGLKQA